MGPEAALLGTHIKNNCVFFKSSPEDISVIAFRESKEEQEGERATLIGCLLVSLDWASRHPDGD